MVAVNAFATVMHFRVSIRGVCVCNSGISPFYPSFPPFGYPIIFLGFFSETWFPDA